MERGLKKAPIEHDTLVISIQQNFKHARVACDREVEGWLNLMTLAKLQHRRSILVSAHVKNIIRQS